MKSKLLFVLLFKVLFFTIGSMAVGFIFWGATERTFLFFPLLVNFICVLFFIPFFFMTTFSGRKKIKVLCTFFSFIPDMIIIIGIPLVLHTQGFDLDLIIHGFYYLDLPLILILDLPLCYFIYKNLINVKSPSVSSH